MDLALQRKRLDKGLTALRHPDLRKALRLKVLPATEHLPVLRLLPPVALVVDVGANVGQFALVARHAFPQARIVSFEPLPQAGALLETVFAGDARFERRALAVSSASGTATFHVTGHDDSSSLLPIARRQVEEFATAESSTVTVTVATLDDELPVADLPDGPVLIKIDTQGNELDVLQGATALLGRAHHLLVEVSFVELYEGQSDVGDVIGFLGDHGWDLRSVYDVKTSRRTGEPLQADAVFARRS